MRNKMFKDKCKIVIKNYKIMKYYFLIKKMNKILNC